MKSKYYETREFKALRSEWYDKLKLDGFYELETEDGAFIEAEIDTKRIKSLDQDTWWDNGAKVSRGGNRKEGRSYGGDTFFEGEVSKMHAEAVEATEALTGMVERAQEALSRVEVWRGLGKDARRWWALQVYCGWTPRRAAEHLGHNWRWIAKVSPEVKARIARG